MELQMVHIEGMIYKKISMAISVHLYELLLGIRYRLFLKL